jgi:hypothetical protein
LELSKQQ